jgi:hypothetical protein
MDLKSTELETIRNAFNVCRIAGIDAVMITENQIRGVSPTRKMALLSPLELSIDPTVKLGVGRINELEKRLGIFNIPPTGDLKVTDSNEVSVLTLQAGKSKVQFRCTAEKLITYPKENEDTAVAVVTATKAEVQQISRAVKTLGAETLTLAIGRDSSVRFECSSTTNESFVTSLEASATFEDDPQAFVHIYEGDRFATVLDAAARDLEEVVLVLGEFGSLTLTVKGCTLVAMPNVNQEDDDD